MLDVFHVLRCHGIHANTVLIPPFFRIDDNDGGGDDDDDDDDDNNIVVYQMLGVLRTCGENNK